MTHGGRLHHLTGPVDKADALRALVATWPGGVDGPLVALGDAANDLPMLLAVDRPIVMPGATAASTRPSPRASAAASERPRRGRRAGARRCSRSLRGEPLPRVARERPARAARRRARRASSARRRSSSASRATTTPARSATWCARWPSASPSTSPADRPCIVNSDGGSRDGTPERRRGDGGRLAAGDPRVAPDPARAADRDPVPRRARQGQRAADDLRDRRAARGARVRGGRLRPAQHHAGVDGAAALAARSSTGSTTWRRSTCATSSTARSRTRSCTR